ncbi:hypothetical protein EJB05_04077, partial [Eragrostis curvula]
MDAASAFVLVKSRLEVRGLTPATRRIPARLTPEVEWATINCATKKAYGCGKHGQILLEGITLYASLADFPDLTSALSITVSNEAVRSIEAEVGSPDGTLEVKGSILTVTGHLLILIVGFVGLENGDRVYYLVYDSADASLYMVPYLPDHLKARYTTTPVAVDTGDSGGHELVLMAREVAGDGDCVFFRYEDLPTPIPKRRRGSKRSAYKVRVVVAAPAPAFFLGSASLGLPPGTWIELLPSAPSACHLDEDLPNIA